MQNVFNFVNNVFSVNSFKTCWLSTIWAKFRIYFSVTVFAVHLIRQIFYQFVVCSRFGKIATNGKGLCEVRATATEISRDDRELAKTIFVFSNLQKKMKWFFAGTAYKFSEISFNPASCKTHVLVAQLKYTNKLV